MNLVLLGPPGAGKGSLAGCLKKTLDLLHISTGDLLRDEMKNGSDLGLQAKAFIDQGELVPDQLVIQLVAQKLKTAASGYMLDGFPRNRSQAEALDDMLQEISMPIDYVIYLTVSLDLIIKRITGRRIALKSGRVYHIPNRPPKVEGICDESGETLIQRPDDKEETVRKRMDVYLENTLPIVEYYEAKGILKRMDGVLDPEELHDKIVELKNA